MRILLVEDDEVIGPQLKKSLVKDGFVVDLVADGTEALYEARMHTYRAILLDLMLPGTDGWEICRQLRAERDPVPILMLTARGQVSDKVKGLDLGADDYLPKPFEYAELLARLRALIRRDQMLKADLLTVADLEIDPNGGTVTVADKPLHLTKREFSLLVALVRAGGRVLSRDFIIDEVWHDENSLSNTVNFHVTLLRKKIDEGRPQSLIETVHGFGYRIRWGDHG